jgi:23S rRNA G2445 N2-methylase RlmL
LYRDIGRVINDRFSAWRIALLVPEDSPVSLLSLKSHREVSLLNGALPVKLLLA